MIFSIAVPECSNRIQSANEDLKKAGDVCNINELFSCGENQVCVQLQPDNNMGQCQCLQGYDKQDDGVIISLFQCWTEGRSSTAVAEDLRPTATALVAEV